jgi:hypothetical protein
VAAQRLADEIHGLPLRRVVVDHSYNVRHVRRPRHVSWSAGTVAVTTLIEGYLPQLGRNCGDDPSPFAGVSGQTV